MQTIQRTKWHSYSTGKLPKGCELCVEGKKLVLFVTGFCAQRCFYCPISEQKFGKDVIFANEWQVADSKNPVELLKEAELTEAEGVGITGGDPLVQVDRCCTYIKMLKEKFGKKFHVHLYTPLKLVTEERLQKLYAAGLDEIRFHPNLDDDSLWSRIELARKYDWDIGVEIPAIPGYEEKTRKLIDYLAGKVDFLNLNELERSDTQAAHYKLDEMKFKTRDSVSYGVAGSAKTALEMLKYAKSKGIPAHFCTAKLKDCVQMLQRLLRRAKNIALPGDRITEEGTLIRGCAYLPELAPGFDYKERIKNAEKTEALKELSRLKENIGGAIDETKLRLLLPEKKVLQNAKKIKQLGFIPAIVEEYPTADATGINIDFL